MLRPICSNVAVTQMLVSTLDCQARRQQLFEPTFEYFSLKNDLMKKEEKIEQDQDQQDKKLLGLWPMAADKNYLY